MNFSYPHTTNHFDGTDLGLTLIGSRESYTNRPSIYVLLFNDEGKVATIQYREEVGRMYPLPGGGVHEGEEWEEGIIREAKEEVGCMIREIEPIGSFDSYDNRTMRCFQSIVCTAKLYGEPVDPEPAEEYEQGSKLVWMTREELFKKLEELAGPVESIKDDRSYFTLEIMKNAVPITTQYPHFTMSHPTLQDSSFVVKKQFMKLIGSNFYVYTENEKQILFAHMAGFKLKEHITIYADESKKETLINIKARQIFDISAVYDIFNAQTQEKLFTVRRVGLRSLFRDKWQILDTKNDHVIGSITEDTMMLSLVRRIINAITEIPILDLSFIPQRFHVEIDGEEVGYYKNDIHALLTKVSIDIRNKEKFNPLIAISVGIILAGVEGKQ